MALTVPEVPAQPRMVVLGRVSGVFGVHGWVKVYSDTAPRNGILNYSPWYLGRPGRWQERRPLEGRVHGKGLIVALEGCEDRDGAALLVGSLIAVRREQLPTADADEIYWWDLEGLRVRTLGGVELGHISHLFETPGNDVLVVRGERERLIPFLAGVVKEVDLAGGLIVVDWDPDF
jgi:16S rRNA processing protein RimM